VAITVDFSRRLACWNGASSEAIRTIILDSEQVQNDNVSLFGDDEGERSDALQRWLPPVRLRSGQVPRNNRGKVASRHNPA